MIISDALSILSLAAGASPDEVAKAYRAAALKYHPDVNPAGEEMMKLVNAAYEALTAPGVNTSAKEYDAQSDPFDYGDALNAALNAIINCGGLEIEVCGAWVWVGGDTFPHKATLKGAGFRWASKKKLWNFRPANWRSKSRGAMPMHDIRETYGSMRPVRPAPSANRAISA